jgi:nucleoside-diphosphate-sugar epimerase
MKFTVFGSTGFIGSNVTKSLAEKNVEVLTPERGEFISSKNLGHVIYCVGVTGDFRSRPFDTIRAHICLLVEILEKAEFESFVYLSSTRIYNRTGVGYEEAFLYADPSDASDLYNLSKMTGESICLSSGRSSVNIVRLSNVYGLDLQSENFLPSIIRDAISKKIIVFETDLLSEKDYVNVKDVVEVVPQIAISSKHKIYNVASGENVSNGDLANLLMEKIDCDMEVKPGAKQIVHPRIDIERVRKDFGFSPSSILMCLPGLIDEYRKELCDD